VTGCLLSGGLSTLGFRCNGEIPGHVRFASLRPEFNAYLVPLLQQILGARDIGVHRLQPLRELAACRKCERDGREGATMSQGSKLLKGQVANLLEDVQWRKRDASPWLEPERSDQETHQVTSSGSAFSKTTNQGSHRVPRLVDGTEAVAQQVFGIKSLNLLHLFGKMALGGIIAENVLDGNPDTLGTVEDPAVDLVKKHKLFVWVCFAGENLPDETVAQSAVRRPFTSHRPVVCLVTCK
jgi:hypothetical protein